MIYILVENPYNTQMQVNGVQYCYISSGVGNLTTANMIISNICSTHANIYMSSDIMQQCLDVLRSLPTLLFFVVCVPLYELRPMFMRTRA